MLQKCLLLKPFKLHMPVIQRLGSMRIVLTQRLT